VIELGYSHLEEEEKEMVTCFIIKKPRLLTSLDGASNRSSSGCAE